MRLITHSDRSHAFPKIFNCAYVRYGRASNTCDQGWLKALALGRGITPRVDIRKVPDESATPSPPPRATLTNLELQPHTGSYAICLVKIEEDDPGSFESAAHGVDVFCRATAWPNGTFHAPNSLQGELRFNREPGPGPIDKGASSANLSCSQHSAYFLSIPSLFLIDEAFS